MSYRRLAVLILLTAGFLGCTLPGTRKAWEMPPPAVREAPVVEAGSLHRSVLANGARVLVLEDHRLPRVVIGVTVRRGAGAVPAESAGLAVYTASLMERGAGDRDALALAQAVDEIGASMGVSAGWDSSSVMLSGLSRDLDRLVEILSDLVLRPHLAAREAQRVRSEQLAQLASAQDDPGTVAGWAAAKVLYPDHRYGEPLSGTVESVSRLDAASARKFHSAVFVPENAILFASGDVRSEDWQKRVGKAFDAWRPGSELSETPAPPKPTPADREIVIVNRPELGQARIIVAHGGIARTSPDRLAAILVNNVLGGSGFSSRLMARVRSDEGLTYSVSSGFAMRRRAGPFRVSTFTRVPEARRVVDLLVLGIESMRTDPPDDKELAGVKSYVLGRFALNLETSSAVMNSLVALDIYGLPEDSLDTYRARVRAVDSADTARVARELLFPDASAIVLVGPSEELVPQFESLGSVRVVEP